MDAVQPSGYLVVDGFGSIDCPLSAELQDVVNVLLGNASAHEILKVRAFTTKGLNDQTALSVGLRRSKEALGQPQLGAQPQLVPHVQASTAAAGSRSVLNRSDVVSLQGLRFFRAKLVKQQIEQATTVQAPSKHLTEDICHEQRSSATHLLPYPARLAKPVTRRRSTAGMSP